MSDNDSERDGEEDDDVSDNASVEIVGEQSGTVEEGGEWVRALGGWYLYEIALWIHGKPKSINVSRIVVKQESI